MLGRGRGLCRTIVLLAALAATAVLAAPAGAAGDDTIQVGGSNGGFRVYQGYEERLFFGAFALYMVDGPLAGRVFEGTDYYLGDDYRYLSAGPASTTGGETSYPSSYAVVDGSSQVLRIDELIRTREGSGDARFTYRVTNVSGGPVAFRPSSMGVVPWGDATVTATPGRSLTFTDQYGRNGARLEEVRSSTIPGDLAPVPVPAWNSHHVDMYHDTFGLLRTAGGLGAAKIVPKEGGTAVEWTDHARTPLAAGATARYEIVWRFGLYPALGLTAAQPQTGYAGATGTVTARLGDAIGNPVAGAAVRWSVSGANPQSERGAVSGADLHERERRQRHDHRLPRRRRGPHP